MGNAFRTAAQAVLLAAAAHQAVRAFRGFDDQCADTLRTAEFVAGQGHRVGAERRKVDGYLPHRLHGVAMQCCAVAVGDFGGLRDRLQHARFVIGEHQGNQLRRVGRRQHGIERIQVDHAIGVNRHTVRAGTGIQDGRVLDRTDKGPGRVGGPHDLVVGLGAAAGKDDLAWRRADEGRHLPPRVLDRLPCLSAGAVNRRCIADAGHRPAKRIDHLRADFRRRVVVQIKAVGHVGLTPRY